MMPLVLELHLDHFTLNMCGDPGEDLGNGSHLAAIQRVARSFMVVFLVVGRLVIVVICLYGRPDQEPGEHEPAHEVPAVDGLESHAFIMTDPC